MSGCKSPLEKTGKRPLVAQYIRSLPKSGIRDFFELVNTMEGVISLGIGEPDFVTPYTSYSSSSLYRIKICRLLEILSFL